MGRTQIIMDSMKKIIMGKEEALELTLICFLARGHLLIEDVPGVGKTTLVKALAKTMGLSYGRIQFTPDLMPSDITGVTLYNKAKEQFVFKKGPIFNQLILADEINRTSPKTQASLLQAMEEGEVSIEDRTYTLEKPFMVLATQNPIEYQGTFPLPEAQLDRFLMKISLGYPEIEVEKEIIKHHHIIKSLHLIQPIFSQEELIEMQEETDQIHVHEDLLHYIASIVDATRRHKDIYLGASPRASIDLYRGAKALAYIKNRGYVIPDDIKKLVVPLLGHRLILSPEARIEGRPVEAVLTEVIKSVSIPVVSILEG